METFWNSGEDRMLGDELIRATSLSRQDLGGVNCQRLHFGLGKRQIVRFSIEQDAGAECISAEIVDSHSRSAEDHPYAF